MGLADYGVCTVFVIVQVRCWPAAMVHPQLPTKSALKSALRPSFNTTLKAPGCSVTRAPFPIANSHWKVCGEPVDSEITVMSQMSEREQSGSVARQSTVFITLKVVVVGVGVCCAAVPSCEQVFSEVVN